MKKNITRVLILSALIMLCIWQTITLWLGNNMSSHNFFGDDVANYSVNCVYPKEIWFNINGSNIYMVEGDNSEDETRYHLLYEMFNELKKDNIKLDLSPQITYAELLSSTSGIVYEYGTNLSINEMMGQTLKVNNSKESNIKVSELYIDLSEMKSYRAYVYLIDSEFNVSQKITINNVLAYHEKALEYYTNEEQMANFKTYQASILIPNDSDRFKGNIFYSVYNMQMPIEYREVLLKPVIADLAEEKVENYVNDLFKNPNYKTKSMAKDGVIFSDNLNLSVKYNKVGTLEFKKTLINDTEKSTSIDKINKIGTFIRESEAIPIFLKKGLYLDEIKVDEHTGETSYRFGYCYDNFDMIMSEQVKKQLDLSAFLELTIKNSEIIKGKWIMLEPTPIYEAGFKKMEQGSNEAIGNIEERLSKASSERKEELVLDNLECAYTVEDISKPLKFKWVGFYREQPIFVNEKIDNE